VSSASFPGQGFHLTTVVFLFVFVAGVFADLLETRQLQFVSAGVWSLLGASAIFNLWRLYGLS